MSLLVERGDVDINAKDNCGRTPLSFAAQRGYEAVVRLLVERGDVDIDAKDDGGRTPLSFAAEKGHEAVVLRSFVNLLYFSLRNLSTIVG